MVFGGDVKVHSMELTIYSDSSTALSTGTLLQPVPLRSPQTSSPQKELPALGLLTSDVSYEGNPPRLAVSSVFPRFATL